MPPYAIITYSPTCKMSSFFLFPNAFWGASPSPPWHIRLFCKKHVCECEGWREEEVGGCFLHSQVGLPRHVSLTHLRLQNAWLRRASRSCLTDNTSPSSPPRHTHTRLDDGDACITGMAYRHVAYIYIGRQGQRKRQRHKATRYKCPILWEEERRGPSREGGECHATSPSQAACLGFLIDVPDREFYVLWESSYFSWE